MALMEFEKGNPNKIRKIKSHEPRAEAQGN